MGPAPFVCLDAALANLGIDLGGTGHATASFARLIEQAALARLAVEFDAKIEAGLALEGLMALVEFGRLPLPAGECLDGGIGEALIGARHYAHLGGLTTRGDQVLQGGAAHLAGGDSLFGVAGLHLVAGLPVSGDVAGRTERPGTEIQ